MDCWYGTDHEKVRGDTAYVLVRTRTIWGIHFRMIDGWEIWFNSFDWNNWTIKQTARQLLKIQYA